MAKEIEHKYLVISENYKIAAQKVTQIVQGYISKNAERVVRVRIVDDEAFITIKGKNKGDTRLEFEYSIPLQDGKELLNLCIGTPIIKQRWIIYFQGYKWEIDEFLNRDIPPIAEIELPESTYDYPLPDFIGKEVTGQPQFYNSNL